MSKVVRRGYVPTDDVEFNEQSVPLLRKAQEDILYLLESGYPMKSASTFVGNHYMLSERQRLAIVRATTKLDDLVKRRKKQVREKIEGGRIVIDGLNLIITLEVALSYSTLIRCMDGTIRDLAGLRGTYRLIDKTDQAIVLLGNKLEEWNVQEVLIYLDAPVSNTGRLKSRILELLDNRHYQVYVELVNNADVLLEKMENVVTTDSIVLNRCHSWINLAAEIVEEKLPMVTFVDLAQHFK